MNDFHQINYHKTPPHGWCIAMETANLDYNPLPSPSTNIHTTSFSLSDMQLRHNGNHEQIFTQWNS